MRYPLNIVSILCFSSIISYACSDISHEYDSVNASININIDEIISDDPIYFSELFSNFKFIPLETNDDAIFSMINSLKLVNDTIFIFEIFRTKSVFIFTQDGSFINKIQNIGRGPGEYIYPADFDVDPISRTIAILDNGTRKLNFYNYEGIFIKSLDLKKRFISFMFHDDHLYFLEDANDLMDKEDNLVYIFDREGNEINRFVQFDRSKYITNFTQFFTGGHFYSSENDVKFFTPYNTTILSIDKNGIYPFLSLNSNKYKLTYQELSKINSDNVFLPATIGINKLLHLKEYSENEKMCFFKFMIGMREYQTFHFFDSNKTICTSRLIDDLTFIYPTLIKLTNNQMIAIISETKIQRFKKLVADGKINLTEKEKASLLEIHDYNNPIIILFNLKQHLEHTL
jgi:hypothetical protein